MGELALGATRLGYRYPDGTRGVEGLTLAIPQGEAWALIGRAGAGKTTLLHLADGLLLATAGEIAIFGQPLTTPENARQARRRVGLVFQNADDQLFSPTVFDDVVFGPLHHGLPPDDAHRLAHEALARLGLEGFEERVPQHLSAGEKRKVALATALAMQPDLLLFDEPTTSLDPLGRRELMQLLPELRSTLVIATHDFELALQVCDGAALVDEGRVVKTGSPEEILFDEALLERHGLLMPTWLPSLKACAPRR